MKNNNNFNKILLILIFLVSLVSAQSAIKSNVTPDCKTAGFINFSFNRYDPSKNFTGAYEYWITGDQTCTMLMNQKSKLNWYSTDISVKYQLSYNLKDGQGCRIDDKEQVMNYTKNTIINMGKGAAAGLDGRDIKDERDVCLCKYFMTNKNTIHDLRF